MHQLQKLLICQLPRAWRQQSGTLMTADADAFTIAMGDPELDLGFLVEQDPVVVALVLGNDRDDRLRVVEHHGGDPDGAEHHDDCHYGIRIDWRDTD